MNVLQKLWAFLSKPKKGFEFIEKEETGKFVEYLLFVALIPSLIIAFYSFLSLNSLSLIVGNIFVFFSFYIIYSLLSLILGMFFCALAYIFGSRGLEKNLKIFCYAFTPFFLLVWLSLLGRDFIFVLFPIIFTWSGILEFLGIRKLQKLSKTRSFALVFIFNSILALFEIYSKILFG